MAKSCLPSLLKSAPTISRMAGAMRVVTESIVKCASPITVKDSDAVWLNGRQIYFAVLIEVTENSRTKPKIIAPEI